MTALNPRFIVGTRSHDRVLDRIERPRSDRRVALGLARDLLDGHLDPRVGGRQHRVVDLADRQRGVDERPRVARELHDAAPRSVKFRHVRVRPYVRAVTGSLGSSGAWSPSAATFQRSFGPSVVTIDSVTPRRATGQPSGPEAVLSSLTATPQPHAGRATYSAAQVRSAVVPG